MAILWNVFKKISLENNYTSHNEEFVRCKYPKSINLRYKIHK